VIALNYVWVTFLSLMSSMNNEPAQSLRHHHYRAWGGDPGQRRRALKTPISSMLLVLLASFIGSFGAVFLKMGRKSCASVSAIS